jgi:flavodoxin
MKNTVVIYKSISGFTKKYAEWIAQELNGDLFTLADIDQNIFKNYNTIIFGGSLHMVGILGVDIIKRNLQGSLKNKKVIVFATGASPFSDDIQLEVMNKNFTDYEKKLLKFYYFRGGFNFSRLDLFNKFLMTLLKWKLMFIKHKTAEEKGMLAAYERPFDSTKKENLKELIDHARNE